MANDETTVPEGYTSEESQESMFTRIVGSLSGQSKSTYDLLQKILKNTEEITQEMTSDALEVLEGLANFKEELIANTLLPSQDILQNILAGVELIMDSTNRFATIEQNRAIAPSETGLLGGLSGGGSKIKPKDKPTVADMLSLPVEHSMGYILLYNKLSDIQNNLKSNKEEGESKKTKGLAGVFSGLMEGVAGLALLAVALITFAGAMVIFQAVDWGPALLGLLSFGIFVTGMVGFAKWVGRSADDFFLFGVSIAVLTASLLLFAAGIFLMATIEPYVEKAIPGVLMFSIFVGAMGLVAKLTSGYRKDFIEFGVGIAALTGSLILFSLGIFVMNKVQPYVPGAITGTVLFSAFVLAMGALSILVGANKQNFKEFGVGITILTGSLILFAGAIFALNAVQPMIGGALGGVALFSAFVLGMTAISLLVKANTKNFILFGAGVAILTGALILFAGTIALLAKVFPQIPAALAGIGLFAGVMAGAVALSVAAAAAMPMFLLFGASTIALSVGLIAFAKAIGDLAKVRENIPVAVETLKASKDILVEIIALGGKTIKAAVAFGPAGSKLGEALITFSIAMEKLGSVKGNMPFAIQGLSAIKEFILDVAQTTSSIDKQAMKTVEVFSKSTRPLSESMINFAKAMVELGSIKENMPVARVGLQAIKDFLFGNPLSKEVSLNTLLEDVKVKTMVKIGVFGEAVKPIAEAIQKFAKAMVDLSGIKKDMPVALEGFQAIKNFLFADEEITKGAKGTSVRTSVASVANSLTYDTLEKLNLFTSSIKPIVDTIQGFANAMATLGSLTPDRMTSAIKGLEAIKDFLFADTPIGTAAGDNKTVGQRLSLVSMMKNVNGEVIERLGLFGENINKVADPIKKFADTMATLAGIKGNMDRAVTGLQEIKKFLFGTGTTADNASPAESSFTAILENVSDVAIRKVGAFGDSASKLMAPIDSLVKSMSPLEKLNITNAKAGLDAIRGFLFGTDGTKDAPGQKSLAKMMDDVGIWAELKLALFGKAINPLSESLITFSNALLNLANIPSLEAAKKGMETAMTLLLGDPRNPSQTSLNSLIVKGTNFFSRNELKDFGIKMAPAIEAFGAFADTIVVLAKLGVGGADAALNNLKSADSILTELNAFTSRVSNTNMATLDTKKLQTAGSNAIAGVNAVNADVIARLRGLSVEDTTSIKIVLTRASELLTIISNLKYDPTKVSQFGASLETLGKGFAALQNINEYNLEGLKQLSKIDIKPLQNLNSLTFSSTLLPTLNDLAGALSSIGGVDLSNLDLINQLSSIKLGGGLPEALSSLSQFVGVAASVRQITDLANSLERIATVNVTASITTPLTELLNKKSDIESLTDSVVKLADAFSAPKTSLLAAVEKGINAANLALQRGATPAAETAPVKEASPLEEVVTSIYTLLVKWDSSTPGTITTTAGPGGMTEVPPVVTNFVPVFAGAGTSESSMKARDWSKKE